MLYTVYTCYIRGELTVEHAEEMEYEAPWSLKAVVKTAETVEPIVRVTR